MWKKIIDTKQVVDTQKLILRNSKNGNEIFPGKSFLQNAKYAVGVVKKTPYIDHMVLKANYLETPRGLSPKNELCIS